MKINRAIRTCVFFLLAFSLIFSCEIPLAEGHAPSATLSIPVEVCVAAPAGALPSKGILDDPSIVLVSVDIRLNGSSVGGGELSPLYEGTPGVITSWHGTFTLSVTGTLEFLVWARDSGSRLRWQGRAEEIVAGATGIMVPVSATRAQLAAGGGSSALIDADGTLWTWGDCRSGQLGHGDNNPRSAPVQIGAAAWTKISYGYLHTAALKADGSLWMAGNDAYGALGFGVSGTHRSTLTRLGSDSWIDVVAGRYRTIGIKADGSLWAWGYNTSYALGDGTTTNRNAPRQIGGGLVLQAGERFVRVASGYDFGLALTNQGRLYGWGSNAYGQLGLGAGATSPTLIGTDTDWAAIAVPAGGYFSLARKTDGTLYASGRDNYGSFGANTATYTAFTQIFGGASVSDFAPGAASSLVVAADGSLWVTGSNGYGQLGLGDTSARSAFTQLGTDLDWTGVAAGDSFSLAMKSDGRVFGFGSVEYGQTGLGRAHYNYEPTLYASGVGQARMNSYLTYISSDGLHAYTTRGGSGHPLETATGLLEAGQNWTKIVKQSWGGYDFLLRSDGALFGIGGNYYGELGLGDTADRASFTRAGGAGSLWTDVAGGAYHVIGVKADGSLWAWGLDSADGRLGLYDADTRTIPTGLRVTAPLQIGSAAGWIAVACGEDWSLALNSSGELWSWGNSEYYRLGDNNETTDRYEPFRIHDGAAWTPVAIGAGRLSGWARTAAGAIYVWGYEYMYDQFGSETIGSDDVMVPTRILSSAAVETAALGDFSALYLLDDGRVLSSSKNDYGMGGNQVGPFGSNTIQVMGSDTDWASIDLYCNGGNDTRALALKDNGELYVFGSNAFGALAEVFGSGNVLSPSLIAF